MVKNRPAKAGDLGDTGLILGQENPLVEGMATHSSMLVWRIPRTEKPGELQSTESDTTKATWHTLLQLKVKTLLHSGKWFILRKEGISIL